MTIFLTIISGVTVLVLGQIILKSFIEPCQMQKECIVKISDHLLLYGNVYSNPGVATDDQAKLVSKETRALAAEWVACRNRIPFYESLTITKIFPSMDIIDKVQKNLIGLSNSLYDGEGRYNHKMAEEIKSLLKIKK